MDRPSCPSVTWEHGLNIFSRCKASSTDCSTGVGFWRLRLHACFYYRYSSARLWSCVWTSQPSGLPCTFTNEYLCIKYPELRTRYWCPWHWVFPPGDALSPSYSSSFHWKLPEVSATGSHDQEQTCSSLFLMPSSAISCFLSQPRWGRLLRALLSEQAACCRWLDTLQGVG